MFIAIVLLALTGTCLTDAMGGYGRDGRPSMGGDGRDGRPSMVGDGRDGRPSMGGDGRDGRPSMGGDGRDGRPSKSLFSFPVVNSCKLDIDLFSPGTFRTYIYVR